MGTILCGINCGQTFQQIRHFDSKLIALLLSSAYINDRQPGKAKFIDNSRLKIGKQSIINRIGPIFSKLDYNWIGSISDDAVRINLKKRFFKYFEWLSRYFNLLTDFQFILIWRLYCILSKPQPTYPICWGPLSF